MICRISLSIFFLVASCIAMSAQSIPKTMALDTFNAANNEYQENNFQRALSGYQYLYDQEMGSADLFYNMGNAYYKLGEYPMSIWSYEKALLLEPGFLDARTNLDLVSKTVTDKVQELPRIVWWHYWQRFKGLLGVSGWTYLSVSMIWLLSIGLYLFMSQTLHSVKRLGVYFAFIGLGLSLFFGGVALNESMMVKNPKAAIIITPNLYVKSAPEETGQDLFVIHGGLKVSLTDEIGEWLKITLADGKSGWVKETEIKRL